MAFAMTRKELADLHGQNDSGDWKVRSSISVVAPVENHDLRCAFGPVWCIRCFGLIIILWRRRRSICMCGRPIPVHNGTLQNSDASYIQF